MRRTLCAASRSFSTPACALRRPTRPTRPPHALLLLQSHRALASEAIQLRDYQEECIGTILENVDQGVRRMAVSLATGSGKTVIFTQLISRLQHPDLPDARQTMILVHRRELVHQAAKHCIDMYPGKVVEIEMASSHSSGRADITVASVQSIINRLDKFDPAQFKLILIDECHHAVSPTYLKCLEHFRALEVTYRTPVVVGVSATVSRFDGVSLGKVMDKVVYHMDTTSMIEKEWLAPPCFTTVRSSVDLTGVRQASGDFSIPELANVVNTDTANEILVKTWMDRASDRKSTLAFCVDLGHVQAVVDMFRKHGIDAQSVTSLTSLQVRRERLENFKAGGFKVLVNCGVFTEGTDIPNIDCILLARPTRSLNLITQMIGRGLRKSEHTGKKDCHIIDMVASVVKGVVTTPTLFGLDPDELLDQTTPEEMEERRLKKLELKQEEADLEEKKRKLLAAMEAVEMARYRHRPEPNTLSLKARGHITLEYTDYDNIWELIGDTRSNSFLAQLSRLCWVMVDNGVFVLSCGKNGTIKIEKVDRGYTVSETRALPAAVTGKGRHVSSHPRTLMKDIREFDAAVRGADTYALKHYPHTLLVRNADWRSDKPTLGQLDFLRKYKKCKEPEFDAWTRAERLTKGKAADMITRLRHGMSGKWTSVTKAKAKMEKEKAREEKSRRRGQVKVGAID